MAINIVIPMAGSGERFKVAGYEKPKPLIDVLGKPMIEQVIDNLKTDLEYRYIFICLEEHFKELEPVLKKVKNKIVKVNKKTEGSACTILLAEEYINNDDPIIIANCDQLINVDMNSFLEEASKYDAMVMTFKSNNPHHSYIKTDKTDKTKAIEVAEKKVISDNAVAGIYYFKKGKIFVDACKKMIDKDIRVNNEFYVSPAINEIINLDVRIFPIKENQKNMLGTPKELNNFLNKLLYENNIWWR